MRGKAISLVKTRVSQSRLRNEGKTMPLSNSEMIDKLKKATMRRCEERIANAGKGSGFNVDGTISPLGVTSLLKSRHGL